MSEYARHEMTMVAAHGSGAEEWRCPECGHRFVMTWPPNYRKVILEQGDPYAIHSGGKGGLRIGTTEIIETEDRILSNELRAALDELDIDGLFNSAD